MRTGLVVTGALWLAQAGAATPGAIAPELLKALPPLPPNQVITLPALDAAKARSEADRAQALGGGPLRYGARVDVPALGKHNAPRPGSWTELPDGDWLWRTEVVAPGALTLDFGFAPFRLPASAELWIQGRDGRVLGPYTDQHNRRSGQLYTPLLAGDTATILLRVDAAERDRVQLALDKATAGFRPQAGYGGPEAKSLRCNVDVACPAADPWRPQVGAVAGYTFGSGNSGLLCTGQLLADATGSSAQRLFVTAAHCLDTDAVAATTVYYWRYESPTCREPGSAASGTPLPLSIATATQSGASLLAVHKDSDVTLLQLDDPVPAAANPFFSGWDRVTDQAERVASIHHPDGDEKRISVEEDDVFPTTQSVSFDDIFLPPGHAWDVTGWDLGTTERGSSGAGLWNEDARLIGVLSGGDFGCGNADNYGRIKTAWEGDGTPATRLRDWLDPTGTGATVADGVGGCAAPEVEVVVVGDSIAGELFTVRAAVAGAGTGLSYAWDLDDDGVVDRTGPQSDLVLSYPAAVSTQLRVTVTDGEGCAGTASRALDVRGPELTASPQAPQQLCGDDDAALEPGERWRLPLTLRNGGEGGFSSNGRALFVPSAAALATPIGPDGYGYTAATSADGCGFEFVDIASGAAAVLPLPMAPASTFPASDEGRNAEAIALMPGMRIYGQPVSQAVMSTNGYIAFSDAESGGDYDVSCPLDAPDRGSQAPRLHVFHDDLELQAGGALRHRWFENCPRPADAGTAGGCHVFQWDDASIIGEDSTFDFQALLYPGNDQLVYQYRSAPPDAGGFASIGLVSGAAGPQLSISCAQPNAIAAGEAICIFDKDAQPGNGAVLIMETPAPALTPLASGASTTASVDLFVPAGASCGAPLAVDFLGAANATQSAPASQRVLDTTVGGGQACTVSSCSAEVPVVDARHGLFYQHARSGNGLLNFVYDQPGDEDIYGAVWYTARPDRSPQWYTVQGPHADNLGQAGIYRFTNTAAPGGFDPEPQQVGQAWIAQPARDDVVFAWRFDDGRAGIELLHSAGVPFASPNRTQQWYQPAESGWGAGVESNQLPGGGYNEFWATFLYDDAGDGRWVVGSSAQREGSVPLVAYQVHCPGCPRLADALQRPEPAGSLSRTWPALDRGLLDTDILLPSPLSGSWLRDDLPIVPLGPVEQP